jgi:hypothetical protein
MRRPLARPALLLPLLAVILVAVVLGVQVASGGGRFAPTRAADPCSPRPVTSQSEGIDGLTERLVLVGLDGAACRLGVSREALILDLAGSGDPTTAQVDALHDGLLAGIDRLDADGTLPPASDLVDEALDSADMNGVLKAVLRALPATVVDSAVKTDDVLRRTVDQLDLRELLSNLDDSADLNQQVSRAVEQAVKDSVVARLQSLT